MADADARANPPRGPPPPAPAVGPPPRKNPLPDHPPPRGAEDDRVHDVVPRGAPVEHPPGARLALHERHRPREAGRGLAPFPRQARVAYLRARARIRESNASGPNPRGRHHATTMESGYESRPFARTNVRHASRNVSSVPTAIWTPACDRSQSPAARAFSNPKR